MRYFYYDGDRIIAEREGSECVGGALFARIKTVWICGEWAGSDLSCGQVGERQVGDGGERKPCR